MSLIDANSCLCANSELDLFTVPPTQTSIESGSYVEYHPVASLNNTNVIEFAVPGSSEDYLDLASTYLHVQAKLTNADGSDTDGGDSVGPVNLMLHSLFSQIDVALNGKTITSSTSTYAYRAMVETLLDYGKPAKESQLTAALFYKDSAGHMDDADTGNGGANIGLRRRVTHTVGSSVVDMMGRLHCDLFFQEKLMISSVGMHLRLVQSKSAFVIMSETQDAKYVVEIVKATLRVRKVRISPTVALAHAKALEYGNAKYPMQRVECKTFTVPANHLSVNQENVFMGQLPTRVVIGCVDNDAYTGRYTKNPFNFKNYKLTEISLQVDGQNQPVSPYKCNFDTKAIVHAYMGLFTDTGKAFKDEDIDITREDFVGGYALYCFDLTPDLGESNHFSLIKTGSVRLNLNFGEALPNTINVICYAEFQNVLEVDKSRNVHYDFTA
jgi:hypothetical protein